MAEKVEVNPTQRGEKVVSLLYNSFKFNQKLIYLKDNVKPKNANLSLRKFKMKRVR